LEGCSCVFFADRHAGWSLLFAKHNLLVSYGNDEFYGS
jgi:hypothetical protein